LWHASASTAPPMPARRPPGFEHCPRARSVVTLEAFLRHPRTVPRATGRLRVTAGDLRSRPRAPPSALEGARGARAGGSRAVSPEPSSRTEGLPLVRLPLGHVRRGRPATAPRTPRAHGTPYPQLRSGRRWGERGGVPRLPRASARRSAGQKAHEPKDGEPKQSEENRHADPPEERGAAGPSPPSLEPRVTASAVLATHRRAPAITTAARRHARRSSRGTIRWMNPRWRNIPRGDANDSPHEQ
jgi:hypothetical protein